VGSWDYYSRRRLTTVAAVAGGDAVPPLHVAVVAVVAAGA
jgi:hypothetical protein